MHAVRRHCLRSIALGALATRAHAATGYPSRVVKVIVPSVPGGATDIIGRTVATGLAKRWPQAVVVENRPGAGTSLGAEYVSKAPADGYTLLIGGIASHAINPAVYRNLGYDPSRSFTPITLIGTLPNVLLARPSFPASNVRELLSLLKANPDKYSYASVGNGTSPHLSAELLWQMSGLKVLHVPYKGSAPAITDLLGGQVPLLFDNISGALPFVRDGKLKVLGVTTSVRSPLLPDTPTFAESGVEGYDLTSWAGLFGPAGLPEAVLARISADATALLREPATVKALLDTGTAARPMTPASFGEFVSSQSAKFRAIAHRANLQVG